jgi:putative DNA methylase
VQQLDAAQQRVSDAKVVSTDPPYYDNVGYADLSDFFYVWLRRSLKSVFRDLFSTLAVPKAEELVATPYRHGSKEKAEAFFLNGMTQAMHRLAEQAHPAFPVTIYYAFKQAEGNDEEGTTSSGWDTFLGAVIRAGFAISGTWPMRTENESRMIGQGTNALASSIVLVCRRRPDNAPLATRREFVTEMKRELPGAIHNLQRGSIAPVDMAQACIGPGMAIFSRYSKVIEADGSPMSVRVALQLINDELEAFLRQEEGEADRDTQFCVSWFEQYGMATGPFGEADVLARAKNTSVEGLVQAGVLTGKGGKVALIPRSNYSSDWDPAADNRLSLWECTQHLVKRYQEGGETAASTLHARLGPGRSEDAKNLAYRLYAICERKGWAEEALAYNEFVVARPEILRKAAALSGEGPQKTLEVEDKE